MKRSLPSLLFFLWTGVLITVYYVVQKPNLYFLPGLADTIWTFLVAALILFNSYGIGQRILKFIRLDASEDIDHLLLSLGIGLGGVGLLGLGVSALQIAKAPILGGIQVALALFFILSKDIKNIQRDIKALRIKTQHLIQPIQQTLKTRDYSAAGIFLFTYTRPPIRSLRRIALSSHPACHNFTRRRPARHR